MYARQSNSINIHSINTHWVCIHQPCDNDSDYKSEDRHGAWPPRSHKVNSRFKSGNQTKPNYTLLLTKDDMVIKSVAVYSSEKGKSQKLKRKLHLPTFHHWVWVYSIRQKLNKVSAQNYLHINIMTMLTVKRWVKSNPSLKVPHSLWRKQERIPHTGYKGSETLSAWQLSFIMSTYVILYTCR